MAYNLFITYSDITLFVGPQYCEAVFVCEGVCVERYVWDWVGGVCGGGEGPRWRSHSFRACIYNTSLSSLSHGNDSTTSSLGGPGNVLLAMTIYDLSVSKISTALVPAAVKWLTVFREIMPIGSCKNDTKL